MSSTEQQNGTWQIVNLKPGDYLEAGDIQIGTGNTDRLAEQHLERVKQDGPEYATPIRSVVRQQYKSAYPGAIYRVIRFIPQVANEFGPVSP